MTDSTAADDPDVISKSEFARRRNVKPPRVTQWIAAKQIFGDAIVGEGRNARIRDSIACQQLNRTLDMSQRLGNGLSTRLTTSPSLPFSSPTLSAGISEVGSGDTPTSPPGSPIPTTQDMIAHERLIQVRRQNERERIDDEITRGRLVDGTKARQEFSRATLELIAAIENKLRDAASAISAEFRLQQRDVLHILRREFRKIRMEKAGEIQKRAASLAEWADFELDDPVG
jgi:hypothetical protein